METAPELAKFYPRQSQTFGRLPSLHPFPQVISERAADLLHTQIVAEAAVLFRLDYVSCVLTVVSTILLGKRCWEGWILAGINSAVICVIGLRTAQFGFIPANLFCIALYAVNLRSWRKPETH
jgi:hypothetical protein